MINSVDHSIGIDICSSSVVDWLMFLMGANLENRNILGQNNLGWNSIWAEFTYLSTEL
jgi:hypothetical protein